MKICCISSPTEAALAIRHGASAIGLVSAMPSGPGVIDERAIAEIVAGVPRPVATFLLTSSVRAEEIVLQQRRTAVDTLQLVDRVARSELLAIREALPGVTLVQVVHVRGERSIGEAAGVAPLVDALLLDSGDPGLEVKELGGTGRTHDWEISRAIVERVDRPVWLAGGLRADNVRAALEGVRPYGLDLCSGVRVEGRLDESRLERFMSAVREESKGSG